MRAPATETTVVLAVHGIHGGAGCALDHAAALERCRRFRTVAVGCHKGAPDLVDVVASAPPGPVVVVPLLMAAAYTLRRICSRLEGSGREIALTPALGSHPRLADMIASEALAGCAARAWRPQTTGVLLVGHGTRRDASSSGTTRCHAERIRAAGRFAEVAAAFLDEPPGVPEALAMMRAERCVAIALLLDRGEHGEKDIPGLLAAPGREAVYRGPLGVSPRVPDLILDLLAAAGRRRLAA